MSTDSSLALVPPPLIRIVEVDVALHPGEPPTRIPVFADSAEEAFRILYEAGNATGGTGVRNIYYGSVLKPLRDGYKARLEAVEASIQQRRAALGLKATEYELRGLAQWAARQRANTARVWRLPTPSLLAGLEARDWRQYGIGGRTFDNLIARSAAQGRTGLAAYEHILGSAVRSNVEVNASVARGARFFRGGGAVLGVAGLAISVCEVASALPEQRGALVHRQAIGFAGGLIGSEIGVGLLAVGAGFLAATPPGWVVIGVGLVAGVAGGMISDRMYFPPDHKPLATRLGAGYAVDPRQHHAGAYYPSGTIAATTLPVIQQVTVTVEKGDSQMSISRRAHSQAALSIGLPAEQADAFARRHASATGMQWVSGDPSPTTDASVRLSDMAASVGRKIVFKLNTMQRDELAELAGTR